MLPSFSDHAGTTGPTAAPVAIIDIGSNSVRLVVYEGAVPAPRPLFNEKLLCGLGRDLNESGRLSPPGVERALGALRRFMQICIGMGVGTMDILATAAIRESSNGTDFVTRAEAICNHPVRVLSGQEEGRLSALGVRAGTPDAAGVVGDLGGGSLELAVIGPNGIGPQATLPLGPLRFPDAGRQPSRKLRSHVESLLAGVDWLPPENPTRFYAVGGAWRNFARLHMAQGDYPLRILHHYRMTGATAREFADFLLNLSPETLSKVRGISMRRAMNLPFAALLLRTLADRMAMAEVIFSANGLREGCLYDGLAPAAQRADPLLVAARRLMIQGASGNHDPVTGGDILWHWIAPLFHATGGGADGDSGENDTGNDARLIHAACLLADIARWDHPAYRTDHAFQRVLRLPVVGITHPGRAFLALAVAARYGKSEGFADTLIGRLISTGRARRAQAVGLAIRLALSLHGKPHEALAHCELKAKNGRIILKLPESARSLNGDVVARRLDDLARILDKEGVIRFGA